MNELMLLLRQAGLSELACQFARFIARLDKTGDQLIAITAALLSEATGQGHVCLNLSQIGGNRQYKSLNLPDSLEHWQQRLAKSHVIGKPGDFTPMILTEKGTVYLYRDWQDEQFIAQEIKQRCQYIPIENPQKMQQKFASWANNNSGIDWQKVAVLMALTRQFSVISGGPGTGKTTIVLRLIDALLTDNDNIKIALAAPTGKAAARLQQATENILPDSITAKTLHRLLGITANNVQGRYNAERPLPVDVVIVDEASMIDLKLMSILLRALPQNARLVLLGDSQQLASVESGAILANLCQQTMQFSTRFCSDLAKIAGIMLEPATQTSVLTDSIVALQYSYRFDPNSAIARLANAVRSSDMQSVFDVLLNSQIPIWQQYNDNSHIVSAVTMLYQPFFDAINNNADPLHCLQLFEQQRVLCALKQGPKSVHFINHAIERHSHKQSWRSQQGFYHGRPIMISQNDYRQQLFNGDTGLILRDGTGDLKACFLFENSLHWYELSCLPAHETAYAITIHKSQGSEFDTVYILLAEEETPLLNRELLYTAITRAKKQLMLLCSETILTQTVTSQYQRETGLADLFVD